MNVAFAVVCVALFWGYCFAMSAALNEERGFWQNGVVHLLSAALYIALMCLAAFGVVNSAPAAPILTVPVFVFAVLVGILLGRRYWTFLIREYVGRSHAALMGIGSMKVEKSYDKARKAEHERDWDGALSEYARAAAEDPGDGEARRRMGEIHLRLDRTEQALQHFRAAVPLKESPEDRTTLSFRIADILDGAGRRDEARALLESVAKEYAGTPFEKYARERLSRIELDKGVSLGEP